MEQDIQRNGYNWRVSRRRGVSVQAKQRLWKQSSVDYKQVPELAGVELVRYRGKARGRCG